MPMRKRGNLGRKTVKSKALEHIRAAEAPDENFLSKGNHVSMKIRYATELPEQLKHLSKGNHVSRKIRFATELPEQLKHLFSMWHVFLA
ncbi:hypothetical protein TNCT_710461 [Trichonephila clavata]|uniref:Uncharacterized protein n=1 Tax=Trichonephila clavata TaxID=2740835 RepID=A0A8X6JB62_TRICU|nr:hypothetical protein TNCT_710461 [Trichonephila clavata]